MADCVLYAVFTLYLILGTRLAESKDNANSTKTVPSAMDTHLLKLVRYQHRQERQLYKMRKEQSSFKLKKDLQTITAGLEEVKRDIVEMQKLNAQAQSSIRHTPLKMELEETNRAVNQLSATVQATKAQKMVLKDQQALITALTTLNDNIRKAENMLMKSEEDKRSWKESFMQETTSQKSEETFLKSITNYVKKFRRVKDDIEDPVSLLNTNRRLKEKDLKTKLEEVIKFHKSIDHELRSVRKDLYKPFNSVNNTQPLYNIKTQVDSLKNELQNFIVSKVEELKEAEDIDIMHNKCDKLIQDMDRKMMHVENELVNLKYRGDKHTNPNYSPEDITRVQLMRDSEVSDVRMLDDLRDEISSLVNLVNNQVE